MRDYQAEYEGRVAFIRELVKNAGASGIVYGNSGGKDSALVGISARPRVTTPSASSCPVPPSATTGRTRTTA